MRPNGRRVSGWAYRFRGVLIVLAVLLVTALTAAALAALGDEGIERPTDPGGVARVRTDGERCAVPLMDGWEWRPASWSLISPQGTTVGFYETLHGRPLYTEWDETVDEMTERYEGNDDVDIVREDDYLRIDFGPNGGLSVVQRFDRVGCHLLFSPPSSDVRADEIDVWETLVESVERTFPEG